MTSCPSGSDTDGQVKVGFNREPTRLQARVDHAPQAAQYYSDELAGYTYLVSSPGHHQALPDTRETYAVEADTAELRHYLARLARRSRCFTRAIGALRTAIKLFVYAWNRLESSGIVANATAAPITGTQRTSLTS